MTDERAIPMRTLHPDTLRLAKGSHSSPDHGLCLMEAVAYFAHEPHSDNPACVSPVLAEFGRTLNDQLSDARRQKLKPLITHLPGTADDGLDEARAYLALDWLVGTYAPTWLDLAGLTELATELRGLRGIVDLECAEAAGPVVRTAHDRVSTVTGLPAWATAWGSAGFGGSGEAAWGAVESAGNIAMDIAGACVVTAVHAGMVAAPRDTSVIASTADHLLDSAIELFVTMIHPRRV